MSAAIHFHLKHYQLLEKKISFAFSKDVDSSNTKVQQSQFITREESYCYY